MKVIAGTIVIVSLLFPMVLFNWGTSEGFSLWGPVVQYSRITYNDPMTGESDKGMAFSFFNPKLYYDPNEYFKEEFDEHLNPYDTTGHDYSAMRNAFAGSILVICLLIPYFRGNCKVVLNT